MGWILDYQDDMKESAIKGEIRGERRGERNGKKKAMELAAKVFSLHMQGMSIDEIAANTEASIADIMQLLGVKA